MHGGSLVCSQRGGWVLRWAPLPLPSITHVSVNTFIMPTYEAVWGVVCGVGTLKELLQCLNWVKECEDPLHRGCIPRSTTGLLCPRVPLTLGFFQLSAFSDFISTKWYFVLTCTFVITNEFEHLPCIQLLCKLFLHLCHLRSELIAVLLPLTCGGNFLMSIYPPHHI